MSAINKFICGYMGKLSQALDTMDMKPIARAVELIQECKGTVWLVGNGGSAALASHMATDLQLAGVRAVALTDVAAVTTYANDEDFQYSFSKQLDRLAGAKDLVIVISGSGNSENIVNAVLAASGRFIDIIGITGFSGGKVGGWIERFKTYNPLITAIHINVPSNHMGVSQDGHQIVLHMICYYLMEVRNAK